MKVKTYFWHYITIILANKFCNATGPSEHAVEQQRGLIPSRSFLSNLYELDAESRIASVRHRQRPTLLSLDFGQAFASVAW